MIVLAVLHAETWFVVLFALAQITDILDGALARALKQQTDIGALLDSYGDLGSYSAAVAGLIVFHQEVFHLPFSPWTYTFAGLYLLDLALGAIRYGRLVTGLHLYSAKVTGYLQGIFLVVLFAYGMIPSFFYVMITAGILSLIEGLIINLAARRPLLNARGLYWVIKDGRLR
jgi:CDP-diacylglycerol--glycerol-3-phosphate 3-phosphatidyltransferase